MTSYATPASFASQSAHLDLDVPDDLDALLNRASRDLDSYLAWPMPLTAGDRIPTGSLTEFQRDCLSAAVCAQAAYRCELSEESLVEGRPQLLAIGGVTYAREAVDRIAPEALTLLAGAGLLRRSGTAPAPPMAA